MSLYTKKPAFGAVRSHVNYSAPAMKSAAMVPMGARRIRGLGTTITNTYQEQLLGRVNDLFAVLDEITALLNQAAQSNIVDPQQQADWISRMDEVSSGSQRLSDRVSTLDDSTLQAWQDELTRLSDLAGNLRNEVASATAAATGSKVMTVAIWTGVSVFGAIGLLLGVRWWTKRRKGRHR
jgi:hypothetical protein